jgi:hypothetical protein
MDGQEDGQVGWGWRGGKERGKTNRFSRKVLALTMFLPMAEAFHAQKEPEGSTW